MFHAIQAAYGWSDTKIMRLRIKRLVQIVHVLQTTAEINVMIRRQELEWQTKTLATFISHLAPSEKGATALLKAAASLSITGDDTPEAPADTSGDGDTRTLDEIMEQGNVKAALARNSQRKGPGLPFMA